MPKRSPRRRANNRWRAMIHRCTNPANIAWHNYGGRGIEVCAEWLASFDAYYTYTGDPPFEGATLDRIDNDGNYEPGNVRWATWSEQVRNRRESVSYHSTITHCPQGHPYDDENTYIWRGHRLCKRCRLEAVRRSTGYQGLPHARDRTHCPKGHPYDAENTYPIPTGGRGCRTCRREWDRENRRRLRAERRAVA